MEKERINCITFPFREITETTCQDFISQYEGPMARFDMHFEHDNSVVVQNIESTRIEDFDLFPNGGFNIKRWVKKREDGTYELKHFHLDILPTLTSETYAYINSRLLDTKGYLRRQKAQALRHALPLIRICPDMALSMVEGDKLFFSFTADGKVMVNKDDCNKALVFDKSISPNVFRFASYVTEIVDDRTDQEYTIRAIGAIYETNLEEIRKKLTLPIVNGTLNINDRASQELIASIAHLEVSHVIRI